MSGEYKILGTGYSNPEDVELSRQVGDSGIRDGERSGNLLRVDLTSSNANRANATVV